MEGGEVGFFVFESVDESGCTVDHCESGTKEEDAAGDLECGDGDPEESEEGVAEEETKCEGDDDKDADDSGHGSADAGFCTFVDGDEDGDDAERVEDSKNGRKCS